MGGFAWVTLATNDSYSLGALVLAHSLKRVNTAHQLAIMITPGVSEAMRTQLSAVFNVVKQVDVLDSQDQENLALLARPELGITFTKLHCWKFTQFDKCVFLDADTIVLQNSDELFEREELSAAPDIGWPDCFNSGVFVFKPSEKTFKDLIDFALVHGTFDGGDQGLLNLYFSDWATKDISKHLPFVYNVVSSTVYTYLPAFKQFKDKLKIIHFIGSSKPWLQPFDTETGVARVTGDAQSQSNFVQLWWDIFCAYVHPSLTSNMNEEESHHEQLTNQYFSKQHYQQQEQQKQSQQNDLAPLHQQKSCPMIHPPPNQKHFPPDNASVTTHDEECKTSSSNKEELGLAGALSTIKLGAPLSSEETALQEHLRQQGWEQGNIDYMGRDSFDNIWKKISETLASGPSPPEPTESTTQVEPSSQAAVSSPPETTPTPLPTQVATEVTPPPPVPEIIKDPTPSQPKSEIPSTQLLSETVTSIIPTAPLSEVPTTQSEISKPTLATQSQEKPVESGPVTSSDPPKSVAGESKKETIPEVVPESLQIAPSSNSTTEEKVPSVQAVETIVDSKPTESVPEKSDQKPAETSPSPQQQEGKSEPEHPKSDLKIIASPAEEKAGTPPTKSEVPQQVPSLPSDPSATAIPSTVPDVPTPLPPVTEPKPVAIIPQPDLPAAQPLPSQVSIDSPQTLSKPAGQEPLPAQTKETTPLPVQTSSTPVIPEKQPSQPQVTIPEKLDLTPPTSPDQHLPKEPKPAPPVPTTPIVTSPTPPASPASVTQEPLTVASKLKVQPEVPSTPPIPQSATQPSLPGSTGDEPPVPPKRKGGKGGSGGAASGASAQGEQGKQHQQQQKGGKGGKGKK